MEVKETKINENGTVAILKVIGEEGELSTLEFLFRKLDQDRVQINPARRTIDNESFEMILWATLKTKSGNPTTLREILKTQPKLANLFKL